MLRVVVAVLFALALGSCAKKTVPLDGPVLKIAVFADGRLSVDGAATTIESLRETLRRHSEKKGVVLYYREAGQAEPPPIAMEVMKAVVEARLPIRLSSKPDYSDAVLPSR
jgi:hypothetical protein